MIFDEADLRKALLPLIDFQKQEDFAAIEEAEGLDTAMSYAVAVNCIEALADNNQDDWLLELISKAREELTEEGQQRLTEQGV